MKKETTYETPGLSEDFAQWNQPRVVVTEGSNGDRTWFERVTGPASVMRAGEIVAAITPDSHVLVRLFQVEVEGDTATSADFEILTCAVHPCRYLQVLDDNSRGFWGLHIWCQACHRIRPFVAGQDSYDVSS